MGNWNMNIQGVGAHHNTKNGYQDLPLDADRMFEKFVQELKDVGHVIDHAIFTYGGKEEVKD